MAVPSRPPVQVRDNIQLNETEKKIFDRLLRTLRHFSLQNQLRVAGGWVRDKLLGKERSAMTLILPWTTCWAVNLWTRFKTTCCTSGKRLRESL